MRHVHERQAARIEGGEAFDVIGLYQGEPGANVQVFRVRDGAVVDRQAFYVENAAGREAGGGARGVPARVLLGRRRDPAAGRRAARGGRRAWPRCWPRGAAPPSTVRAAKRGPKRRLLELAQRNAELAAQAEVERLRAPHARRASRRSSACATASASSGLPLRIECYDISNLGEQHAVGSMVVFEGGVAKKAHYRKFALRDVPGRTTSR